jgi:23S rRNA pseudouridine1911/1915/1917 synthase
MESIRTLEYTAVSAASVKNILKNIFHLSAREISHAKTFEDGITCEGKQVTVRHILQPGMTLRVSLHENINSSADIIPVCGPIDIVYEDEDLICLNKAPGVAVHPCLGHHDDTLGNYLAWYYMQKNEEHVLRPAGRLDIETSGLIIYAKNRPAAAALSAQSTSGDRVKEYLALCKGVPDRTDGIIDAPLKRLPEKPLRMCVSEDGLPGMTEYHIEKNFGSYSLIRLRLHSGRTHQIRVHMSSIGHPLLGDRLYSTQSIGITYDIDSGSKRCTIAGTDQAKFSACNDSAVCTGIAARSSDVGSAKEALPVAMSRCALHSSHIEFIHPFSGKKMSFTAPVPPDMAVLIS